MSLMVPLPDAGAKISNDEFYLRQINENMKVIEERVGSPERVAGRLLTILRETNGGATAETLHRLPLEEQGRIITQLRQSFEAPKALLPLVTESFHGAAATEELTKIFKGMFQDTPDFARNLVGKMLPPHVQIFQKSSSREPGVYTFVLQFPKAYKTRVNKVGQNGYARAVGARLFCTQRVEGKIAPEKGVLEFAKGNLIVKHKIARILPSVALCLRRMVLGTVERSPELHLDVEGKINRSITWNASQINGTIEHIEWD